MVLCPNKLPESERVCSGICRTVVKINKNEKFIYVRFTLGEKKFIFPDAFLMGFLKL